MKKILIGVISLTAALAIMLSVSTVSAESKCTMDIQCGVGKKCVSGVCVGGIAPRAKGKCVSGRYGKKVCTNTGKECNNDSQCFR